MVPCRCAICGRLDDHLYEDDFFWVGWPKRYLVCWACYEDIKLSLRRAGLDILFCSVETVDGHKVMEVM